MCATVGMSLKEHTYATQMGCFEAGFVHHVQRGTSAAAYRVQSVQMVMSRVKQAATASRAQQDTLVSWVYVRIVLLDEHQAQTLRLAKRVISGCNQLVWSAWLVKPPPTPLMELNVSLRQMACDQCWQEMIRSGV